MLFNTGKFSHNRRYCFFINKFCFSVRDARYNEGGGSVVSAVASHLQECEFARSPSSHTVVLQFLRHSVIQDGMLIYDCVCVYVCIDGHQCCLYTLLWPKQVGRRQMSTENKAGVLGCGFAKHLNAHIYKHRHRKELSESLSVSIERSSSKHMLVKELLLYLFFSRECWCFIPSDPDCLFFEDVSFIFYFFAGEFSHSCA